MSAIAIPPASTVNTPSLFRSLTHAIYLRFVRWLSRNESSGISRHCEPPADYFGRDLDRVNVSFLIDANEPCDIVIRVVIFNKTFDPVLGFGFDYRCTISDCDVPGLADDIAEVFAKRFASDCAPPF